MSPHLFVFDFEAHKITPDRPNPKTVCMSYGWIDRRSMSVTGVDLVTAAEGHRMLNGLLKRPDVHFVTANGAFDIEEDIVWNEAGEEEQHLWVNALERDRVHDVLLRQGLHDLATDFFQRKPYSLDDITRANLGYQLDKDKDLREGFGALDGVPIAQYPTRERNYAIADTVATGQNWIHQEIQRQRGSKYFPGLDTLRNEFERIRKAVALKDHESTGMRANAYTVALYESWLRRQIDEARKVLVPAGLVRRKITRPKGAIGQYCDAANVTPRPKNFGAKTLADHPDPVLRHYRDAEPPQCVLDAGVVKISYHDVDAAVTRELASCLPPVVARYYDWEALRFSCLDVEPKTPTQKQNRAAFLDLLERERIQLTPTFALKVDSDACSRSGVDVLKVFGRYSSLCNTLNNPVKLAKKHTSVTLRPFYRPLVQTGRTSTSPNVQNMKREPGVREMWEAPPGWVIVDGDFTAVELHAFSEICYRVLGWSHTGDALNAGEDLHSKVAAALLGITYDQALALKAVDDFEFTRARTAGKGVNFGAKGGMRAKKFVQYCWNNYRIEITRERAEELLALHDKICGEFPHYSRNYAQAFAREPGQRFGGVYDIVQPWSGRLRAGCAYTDAHNSPFQGLAADLAGVTLWELYKETRGCGPLGKASPLYGCRLYLFVHDSFAVLCPEGRHTEAAKRLQFVGEECGRRVLPHCPPKVEVCVARQLSKKAKLIKKPDGSYDVWDLWEQIRKAYAKAADVFTIDGVTFTGRDAKIARLRKDEWPEYAIEQLAA
jgi:hypothetical protein